MRQIKALAVLFALLPGIAAAQQILPKNTVWGRLGVTASGPAQAIEFATLFANAGIAAGPQSCASHNWFSSLGTGGALVCTQPSFADLTSTIAAAQLIPPTGSTLGGVQSKDCSSGSQFLQKINTDGTITCATPAGAGTVTEQKNTASVGIVTSGNCDNTSSNSGSPCNVALTLGNTTVEATPSNPTGTVATSAVFMGLGASCHITPTYSGRIKLEFYGVMTAAGGFAATNTVRYGTSTAPTNGTAVGGTGNQVGAPMQVAGSGSSTVSVPFANGGIVTALTPGTAYWFDLTLVSSSASGSQTIASPSCNAFEF